MNHWDWHGSELQDLDFGGLSSLLQNASTESFHSPSTKDTHNTGRVSIPPPHWVVQSLHGPIRHNEKDINN